MTCGQVILKMKINFLATVITLSCLFVPGIFAKIVPRFDEFQRRSILNVSTKTGIAMLFMQNSPNPLLSHLKYLTDNYKRLAVQDEAKFNMFMDGLGKRRSELNAGVNADYEYLEKIKKEKAAEEAKFVLFRSKDKIAELDAKIAAKLEEVKVQGEESEVLENFSKYCAKRGVYSYKIVDGPDTPIGDDEKDATTFGYTPRAKSH